jgi:hypothetical protein
VFPPFSTKFQEIVIGDIPIGPIGVVVVVVVSIFLSPFGVVEVSVFLVMTVPSPLRVVVVLILGSSSAGLDGLPLPLRTSLALRGVGAGSPFLFFF